MAEQNRMRTPRHETALRYARDNIPVFPCVVGGKEPATGRGFHDATTDTWIIERWWAKADYNIGTVPENAGWCVLDIDDLAVWTAQDGEKPLTHTVATPSGGLHLYYAGSLPSTASKLAPGIDTRGRGGYVLVPPSIVDGKEYTVLDARAPAPLPDWIPAKLAHVERPRLETPVGIDLDLPINIERAKTFLRGQYGAVEGEGGDQHTYIMAQYTLDAGLSVEGAFDAMQEWNARCYPPWDDDALRLKIENAWKYRQNAPGAYALNEGTPASWQSYISTIAAEPEPEKPKFPSFRPWAVLREQVFTPPQWVWKDRLLALEPNLYTGDAGVGKTTFAENLAVAVASGIPFLGQPTMQMPVYLMCAEDHYGPVRDNIAAISAVHGLSELDVHVLSVKTDRMSSGHRLASISDDGRVAETAFLRHVLDELHATGRDTSASEAGGMGLRGLWIIDPLAEFVQFNNLLDVPCRALATSFLGPICQSLGLSILVNDHPSKASMASGAHYGGSVQLKAAFSLFATLLAGEWSGALQKQRRLTFKVLKGRYAGEESVDFYRTSTSPVMSMEGLAELNPRENVRRVYEHVKERLDRGEYTGQDDRSEYGPGEVAYALHMDAMAVKMAIKTCVAAGYIQWQRRSNNHGEKGHFELGHNAPLIEY